MKHFTWILTLIFSFQVTFVFAQQGLNIPVPMDTAVRYGVLDNGMTYYIRHNEEPKERASFYIIQNVGALLEEDNQNGLAHFLEHMAFNGTQHFEGKGIINTLEKHGVAFGDNINAYTSYNETVYNLSDVPVTHPGLIDTCLLVLNDWSNYLLLTDEEIDLERGVITEEWRTRRDASFRLSKQYYPVLLKGSKYVVRDLIGDLDIIQNFDYETLRDFYHDWYRTDLQSIAIVGDIDVDVIEEKVKELFSKIPAVENPKERVEFEIPEHQETLYVLATDEEASQSSIAIYIKHKSEEPEVKTFVYLRDQYINTLFNAMMSERIYELLQKGDPPFITGGISYRNLLGGYARGYDILGITATAKPNMEETALRSVFTEAQRVKEHGFTASELERAKINLLTAVETFYNQRDKINNDQYANSIRDYYLNGEPLTSAEFDWMFVQNILPTISVEDVSNKAKEWIIPENRVVIIQGPPESEELAHLSEEQALEIIREVENMDIDPYEDVAQLSSLIEEELEGSPVVKTSELEAFDAVEWTLANNTTVVYRKADYEKDNVLLYGYSKGGSSLFETSVLSSAFMVNYFMDAYGVGDFDAVTLNKLLAGKNVSLGIDLSDLQEVFSGSSTPKDFETLLQLLYLQFERPRFDREAYDALFSRYEAYWANLQNDPAKIINDSLVLILSDYNSRTKITGMDMLKEVSFDQMAEIYNNRFMDAGDFVFFIVGNIEADTVKPLIEKYLGSLKDDPREEKWKDNNVRVPEGTVTKEIRIPLETEKATVFINYSSEMAFSPEQNLALDAFERILRLRYTEEIRENEGGSYSVSVSSSSQHFPFEEQVLQIYFETDPEKGDYLKELVYDEIEKIIQNGPTQEDLDKVKENMLKEREESKLHNNYWMASLRSYYIHSINNDDPANYEDVINDMTISDIKKFAEEFVSEANIVDVIFKPLVE